MKKKFALLFSLIVLGWFAYNWSSAQEKTISSVLPFQQLGYMSGAIGPDTITNNTTAFVPRGKSLRFYDISNLPQITDIEVQLVFEKSITGFTISGNNGYVTAGNMIYIIEFSNITNPTILGSYSFPATAYLLHPTVQNNYLYVANRNNTSFSIINISNPTTMIEVGSYEQSFYTPFINLAVNGNNLYLSHSWDGIYIFNISDPTTPQFIAKIIPPADAQYDLELNNNLLYISTNVGVYIYDASITNTLTQRSLYATNSSSAISVTDNQLAILTETDEPCNNNNSKFIELVNISNPSAPAKIGASMNVDSFECSNRFDLYLTDKNLYLANPAEFSIYDTTPAQQWDWITDLPVINGITNLIIDETNDTVHLSSPYKAGRFASININNGAHPTASYSVVAPLYNPDILSNTPIIGTSAISGDTYYFGQTQADQGLMIFSTVTSTHPVLVNHIDGFSVSSLAIIADSYLYVGLEYPTDLLIFDITNPINPILIGSAPTSDTMDQMLTIGSYLYTAESSSGFSIWNVSDPTTPQKISSYTATVTELAIHNDIAYLVKENYGLTVVDISNPISPTLISNINHNGGSVEAVAANDLYVIMAISGSNSRIMILNQADLSLNSVIPMAGITEFSKLALVKNNLYLTTYSDLYIFAQQNHHQFIPFIAN